MGKLKDNGGYSLVELMVAMVILGIITVPVLSGMLVSIKAMSYSEQIMKSQLAVSSAVETLMAKGISSAAAPEMEGVIIEVEEVTGKPYYNVTVTSEALSGVQVETVIRKVGGGTE